MWDPYCMSPTPSQGRCFFETLSAVGFKPLLPISLFILYHILLPSVKIYFLNLIFFFLEDNHHLSLTFFNNIITYFLLFCQVLFLGLWTNLVRRKGYICGSRHSLTMLRIIVYIAVQPRLDAFHIRYFLMKFLNFFNYIII
jgi:hypothetical protein